MDVSDAKRGELIVLEPVGRLDSKTSHELEEKVITLLGGGGRRFVVDFGRIDYISSAGLRVLLMLAKRLTGMDGQLVLCALNDHVKEVFDIAGFTSVFTIVPNRTQALGTIAAPAEVAPPSEIFDLAARLLEITEKNVQPAAPEPTPPPDEETSAEIGTRAAELLGIAGEASRETFEPGPSESEEPPKRRRWFDR